VISPQQGSCNEIESLQGRAPHQAEEPTTHRRCRIDTLKEGRKHVFLLLVIMLSLLHRGPVAGGVPSVTMLGRLIQVSRFIQIL